MELVIIIILDNRKTVFVGKLYQFQPSLQTQCHSGRILMVWGNVNCPYLFTRFQIGNNLLDQQAVLVYAYRQQCCPSILKGGPSRLISWVFNDYVIIFCKQILRCEIHRHLTASGDTDIMMIDLHASLVIEHLHYGFWKFQIT